MQSCNNIYSKYLNKHVDVKNAAQWEQEYNPNGKEEEETIRCCLFVFSLFSILLLFFCFFVFFLGDGRAGYSPTSNGGMGFNFNDCKKDASKSNKTSSSKDDGGGASWKPTEDVLNKLKEQQMILKKCQTNYLRSTMKQYSAIPIVSSSSSSSSSTFHFSVVLIHSLLIHNLLIHNLLIHIFLLLLLDEGDT
jgi:hypothetical protein